MFSLDHFPKGSPVWHFQASAGAFWILPTPSHKYLWGIDDRTLGLSLSIPLILDFIRRQKTSYAEWDRLTPCPNIPGLEAWVMSRGNGAFTYRYSQPDLGRRPARPHLHQTAGGLPQPMTQDTAQNCA